MSRLFILLFLFITTTASAFANGEGVALNQKIGEYLPSDLVFTDEAGAQVRLADMIDKPTIFVPVYLSCPHTCPLILSAMSSALGNLKWVVPGRDFQVVALSFNKNDTPEIAREKKKNYLAPISKVVPENAWKFLVGDQKNIDRFLASSGFHVEPYGMEFSHPAAIFIVSKKGQIIRYLPGMNYGAFDLSMAVTEAAQGVLSTPTSRVLGYCFTYDPNKRSYVFNVLRTTGIAMVVTLLAFLVFLLMTSRKRKDA